jgi:N-methylhydantoinase B
MVDGHVDENVFGLILANVRSPRETGGDFRAQVASLNIGTRRYLELVAKHGTEGLASLTEELLDYTERRVRAEVATLPQGTFRAEGHLDDDGFTDVPIKVVVQIAIDRDHVVFDLTGSDPQRPCSVNTTYAMSYAACAYALRALIDPDLPMNDGFYRVLRVA